MVEGSQDPSSEEMKKSGEEGRPITWQDLGRLQVDGKGRLLWDGRAVEVSKSFSLTRWQIAYAIISLVIAAAGVAAAVSSAWADWEMVRMERSLGADKRELK